MAKAKKTAVSVEQPTPAARVVRGVAFRVARKPEGIASAVTEALQKVAKSAKSQRWQMWGVFPVWGRDVVIAGYLSARTPRQSESTWMVEPGGTLAKEHLVVELQLSEGGPVGRASDERSDIDCVEEFIEALTTSDAWSELDATAMESSSEAAWWMLTDDGRGADVAYGMSFWRAGSTYSEGRVQTWTRPVGDDDAVRVVGVRAARVDRESPMCKVPEECGRDGDAWREAARRETRAALDSERSFQWYFVADAGG